MRFVSFYRVLAHPTLAWRDFCPMLHDVFNKKGKENIMQHTHALHNAVNLLHQEADSLAAVASLCYNGADVHDLEHVHAAHF